MCESDGVGVGVCDLSVRVLETWADGGGVKLMLPVASTTRSAWTFETASVVPCDMLAWEGFGVMGAACGTRPKLLSEWEVIVDCA